MLIDKSSSFQLKPLDDSQKNTSKFLAIKDQKLKLSKLLLFARPLGPDSVLSYSFAGVEESQRKNIRQPVLLLTTDFIDVNFKEQWEVETLAVERLTTLFAFLNYQANNWGHVKSIETEKKYSVLVNSKANFIALVESGNKSFISFLVSEMLHSGRDFMSELFTFVCSMEQYWIAFFLLSQVMDEKKEIEAYKIYNAYKVYGVSESFFRKLCHNAFTCGPKKQLRIWRAAQSALQLIEQDNTIATIAENNGYSSSSHFCSEMKRIFGITPREFKKMGGFLHE